jgi:hypothetical protein
MEGRYSGRRSYQPEHTAIATAASSFNFGIRLDCTSGLKGSHRRQTVETPRFGERTIQVRSSTTTQKLGFLGVFRFDLSKFKGEICHVDRRAKSLSAKGFQGNS